MRENWVVAPEFKELNKQLRQAVAQFDQTGELIVAGDRNTIRKVEINGSWYSIKRFKIPNAFQSLVYRFLRKSKAQRSYLYGMKLLAADLGTPTPVAYLEQFGLGLKQSFYISRHLDYDLDFRVLIHKPLYPDRKKILRQFTKFTYDLHQQGIQFLDHSPGNTLIVKVGEDYHFYLIDLNRMRFGTMNLENRMRNFRRLWLSKAMIKVMAPVYAELYGESTDHIHELMLRYSGQFQKKITAKKVRRRRRRS
ncbi:lipopolysaccharide kinase InaA family protein [Aureitalea marina]|uniref:Lipopolysaccharide kinase n=1 Tax=Aureitalea marina TaxID=930804 RepID=A0A2S7KQ18_9FLAO|nr:lipopolysaccharide kinase InaA family protein [Aureitalea marina]PQB04722.1 lipopolysaccharide kinase [Aureitalea marina]